MTADKRKEILSKAKPILFNTEMVRAILDGRKTVTRRAIKPQQSPLCDIDDILYVRETWCRIDGKYFYRADNEEINISTFKGSTTIFGKADGLKWKPSIHMPKEAARIFLKVTNVRVERLQDITPEQAINEGVGDLFYEDIGYGDKDYGNPVDKEFGIAKEQFAWLWESTVKKKDLDKYGWDANPWVWVIEFERVDQNGEN